MVAIGLIGRLAHGERGERRHEQDSPKQHAGSEASFRYPACRPKAGAKHVPYDGRSTSLDLPFKAYNGN
jgi:hypothetical protein